MCVSEMVVAMCRIQSIPTTITAAGRAARELPLDWGAEWATVPDRKVGDGQGCRCQRRAIIVTLVWR